MNEEVKEEGKTGERNVVVIIQNACKVMGVNEITQGEKRGQTREEK